MSADIVVRHGGVDYRLRWDVIRFGRRVIRRVLMAFRADGTSDVTFAVGRVLRRDGWWSAELGEGGDDRRIGLLSRRLSAQDAVMRVARDPQSDTMFAGLYAAAAQRAACIS